MRPIDWTPVCALAATLAIAVVPNAALAEAPSGILKSVNLEHYRLRIAIAVDHARDRPSRAATYQALSTAQVDAQRMSPGEFAHQKRAMRREVPSLGIGSASPSQGHTLKLTDYNVMPDLEQDRLAVELKGSDSDVTWAGAVLQRAMEPYMANLPELHINAWDENVAKLYFEAHVSREPTVNTTARRVMMDTLHELFRDAADRPSALATELGSPSQSPPAADGEQGLEWYKPGSLAATAKEMHSARLYMPID